MTGDMTVGKPFKLILKFMIPLLLGNIFQQLYNLADSVIVGRFLGINALAAVGASSSLVFLIIGFVNGSCSGFAIPVAQTFGAKREDELRKYVFNSYVLCIGIAVVLTALTCLFCDNILKLMGTPDKIFSDAYAYLFIIFAGIPCTFLYNILSGIIRSLGDSKTPFKFLLISTVINIVGDLVLIIVFNMGVMGAAIATITAQGISGLLCLLYIRKHYQILKFHAEDKEVSAVHCKKLLYIGMPMGMQFSVIAIGSIMLQSSVNAMGTAAVAAYTAALKIKQLMMCPFDAIGNAIATYAGQNLGAKKYSRIYEGLKVSLIIGAVFSIAAGVLMNLFGGTMCTLFVDSANTEVIDMAHQYLSTIGCFYLALCLVCVMRCVVQGLGYSNLAFFSGVLEMIARTCMSLFVIPVFGYTAVCFTDPTAWVSGIIFLIPLFFYVMKKLQSE